MPSTAMPSTSRLAGTSVLMPISWKRLPRRSVSQLLPTGASTTGAPGPRTWRQIAVIIAVERRAVIDAGHRKPARVHQRPGEFITFGEVKDGVAEGAG